MGDDLDIDGDIGNEAGEDAGGLHDRIATNMWADYLTFRHTHDTVDLDDNMGGDHM